MSALIRLLGCGALLLAAGCSGDKHGRQPLSGTVKLRGEALAHASIRFTGEESRDFDTGAMVTDGRYEIGREFGLPPGKYRVHISLQQLKGAKGKVNANVPGADDGGEMEQLVPAPYSTEGVVVEVRKGEPNRFDFDIK